MFPAHPRSPYARAKRTLSRYHHQDTTLLAPSAPPGRTADELEREAAMLLRLLWSPIQARYSKAEQDDVIAVLWTVAALGGSIDHPDEAFALFDLIARFEDSVGAVEIREAHRVLGDQADLFLAAWTKGLHQRLTGTREFAVALWEYGTYLQLSEDGEAQARRLAQLPEPARLTSGCERTSDARGHGPARRAGPG